MNAVTVERKVSVYRGSSPMLPQTHARRDLAGSSTAAQQLIVPATEEKYFTNPGAWWDLYWETRFHDDDARHSKWPVASNAFTGDLIYDGGRIILWISTVFRTPFRMP